MKNLSIDTSKLKIRHALGIQNNFEDYPTNEDFLYDLVRVLTEIDKLNSEFQVHELWKYFLDVPSNGKTYQSYILDQVNDGFVEIIEEEPKNKKFITFKLIKHHWIKTE